jgi:hypothetical protein
MLKCPSCGRDIAPPDTDCRFCADREGQVTVLTPSERENFQGVTLDSGPTGERGGEESYSYESRGPHHRVYVRRVSFGGGTSLWTKLVILAVIGLAVFVILPMFFLFFAAAGLVWFILRLLRR